MKYALVLDIRTQRVRLCHGQHGHARVGRKYAYIELGRFSIETGESNHSCSTIRANGYGFDVYDTEQSYLQKMNEDQEYERLKVRLRCEYRFPALKPETVAAIHRALDDNSEC